MWIAGPANPDLELEEGSLEKEMKLMPSIKGQTGVLQVEGEAVLIRTIHCQKRRTGWGREYTSVKKDKSHWGREFKVRGNKEKARLESLSEVRS